MVGHLTREYSRIAWYFLARGGWISVEVSSHHWHCKHLCGGMEIPCWVTFTCSRRATLNWSKALFKMVIYANLRHGVQMFSQISHIPDLVRKFWAKNCGLYVGVYGNLYSLYYSCPPEIKNQREHLCFGINNHNSVHKLAMHSLTHLITGLFSNQEQSKTFQIVNQNAL